MKGVFVGVLLCVSLFSCTAGTIRFSNVLGDNMVLQREPHQAVVWGFSSPNDEVTVTFGNFRDSVTANAKGEFSITLPATHPGGPYTILAESKAGGKAMLNNVLFGDVFLCGGQSNMQFTVPSAFNASMEIAAANRYENIRVMTVGQGTQSPTPLSELGSIAQNWSLASNASIGHGNWSYFSAACWFFGRDLYDANGDVPVGLISNNWGGTPVQSWSGPDALAKCNQTAGILEEKEIIPGTETLVGANSNLWNAMIVPYLPMRLIGAVWYQGEANVGTGPQHGEAYYGCQFTSMIQDWRDKFNLENMFFGFVQLAPWKAGGNTLVAELRTGQEAALKLPMVGMATAADHGDLASPFGTVHPRDKQPVGLRLSAAARAILYGEKLVYQGPMISSTHVNGNQVVVEFEPSTLGSGLQMKPASCPEGLPEQYCMGFELQTSDMHWHAAKGTIQGNTVVVSMESGNPAASLAAVRYGYADWPICTIYNVEGYPAIPFSRQL
eukprot:m.307063 g.307063  ORF g.307063 m.307063 type:complete len:497 (+) comp41859_c0_seq1:921-2411(+)